jgi:hypothetical protein
MPLRQLSEPRKRRMLVGGSSGDEAEHTIAALKRVQLAQQTKNGPALESGPEDP